MNIHQDSGHRLIFVNMEVYSNFNLLKMSICTDVKDILLTVVFHA